jgi:CheY-like chemotaxis protein
MGKTSRAPAHLYVIEDDQDVRTSIAEILRDEGYEVTEFGDGARALLALERGARPCLVLVDLHMPAMSGLHLAERVRDDSALCSIPVVIITGASVSPTGFTCLHKPFALKELTELARIHCGHRDEGARNPDHSAAS